MSRVVQATPGVLLAAALVRAAGAAGAASLAPGADPQLVYATFLGGGYAEAMGAGGSRGIAVGSFDGMAADIFAKSLEPDGSLRFVWGFSGSKSETAMAAVIDGQGNLFVAGATNSPDLPVTPNAFQTSQADPPWTNSGDAFLAKLSPTGVLLYCTYLGGTGGGEIVEAIGVDASGRAIVTGRTMSLAFPTKNPIQPAYAGGSSDAFVTCLDAPGSALAFSTYLGGVGSDLGYGIAVGPAGESYVTGWTDSQNFPVANAYQPSSGGWADAFVTKLDGAGALVFSTYLGGSSTDVASGIALGPGGEPTIVGTTSSTDFPTANPYQSSFSGILDSFVARLTTAGDRLVHATYFGGRGNDDGQSIAVDGSGRSWIVGETFSPDLPLAAPLQASRGMETDAFVACIDSTGSTLAFSSYLGGRETDRASGIVIAGADVYLTGYTNSPDFPLANAAEPTLDPSQDSFAVRLSMACGAISLDPAALPDGAVGVPYVQSLVPSGGSAPFRFRIGLGAPPPGLALDAAGTVSGTPLSPGTFQMLVTVVDRTGLCGQRDYALTISGAAGENIVAGQGLGVTNPNRVRAFRQDGTPTPVLFDAYGAGRWGVNVSGGNVTGAARGQILTGPGPGDAFGPTVRGFDAMGFPLTKINYWAYATLRYGVNVRGEELDADGFDEIVTGAGPGAVFGPHVRGWQFDGGPIVAAPRASFFAYSTLKFGVNVGAADVDGDGFEEVLCGPGPGPAFGPLVRAFDYDGIAMAAMAKINYWALPQQGFGVNVDGGDLDGDGFGEMAATFGPGPGLFFPARFLGYDYDAASVRAMPSIDLTLRHGTGYGGRIGIGDVTGDTDEDLLAAPGRDPSAPAILHPYSYAGALLRLPEIDAFPGAGFGVNAASSALGH